MQTRFKPRVSDQAKVRQFCRILETRGIYAAALYGALQLRWSATVHAYLRAVNDQSLGTKEVWQEAARCHRSLKKQYGV